MFSSKDLFFTPAVSTGYTVSKSLRFRSSASAYLNRTPSASSSDPRTWTFSAWVKRGALNTTQAIISAGTNAAASPYETQCYIDSSNVLIFNWNGNGGGIGDNWTSAAVFRDPGAWYHILLKADIGNATRANRLLLYVNGVLQTFPAGGSGSNSATTNWELSGQVMTIARSSYSAANYFDGYMAEVNFIDGQALTPSSFGAYDTNGIWQPAAYTGSYGTNGFYLKFTDVGATSGSNTGYGKDFAGTNYWTTNNFGTTSTATTYDSMLDSPTNATGDIGNYAVANPNAKNTNITISNGNLTATSDATTNWRSGGVTFGNITSGKWYYEATATTISSTAYVSVGWQSTSADQTSQGNGVGAGASNAFGVLMNTSLRQTKANASIVGSDSNTNASGDIIMVAVDFDNSKAWIGKNGTWYDSGNPSTGANPIATVLSGGLSPAYQVYNAAVLNLNFGQRPFTYTPPSGFSALNTQNLSTPTITNGAQYMAAVTYDGTGSSQTITTSSTNSGNNPNGTTFQPDFVWTKGRGTATYNNHLLFDAVRGTTKFLQSNQTAAEGTDATTLTAFNANGFSIGGFTDLNTSGNTYIGWQWNAGGSNATNTTGTIQSTVRANPTAGFSVVTYTGTGANATVGHGLGVAPSMIITKEINTSVGNWNTYHVSLGRSAYIALNTTSASGTASNYWGTSDPSSTVFGLGTFGNNTNTTTYVAYCFAPVAGYSSFGSYTGNGSADGPFIFTGFRPRWLMVKNTSTAATDWFIVDSSINTYNVVSALLVPNSSGAEVSSLTICDFLSNGFKFRDTNSSRNASGSTYIYAAFAENPFKISRAR